MCGVNGVTPFHAQSDKTSGRNQHPGVMMHSPTMSLLCLAAPCSLHLTATFASPLLNNKLRCRIIFLPPYLPHPHPHPHHQQQHLYTGANQSLSRAHIHTHIRMRPPLFTSHRYMLITSPMQSCLYLPEFMSDRCRLEDADLLS